MAGDSLALTATRDELLDLDPLREVSLDMSDNQFPKASHASGHVDLQDLPFVPKDYHAGIARDSETSSGGRG